MMKKLPSVISCCSRRVKKKQETDGTPLGRTMRKDESLYVFFPLNYFHIKGYLSL